jgi:hypothetical protein
MRSNRFEHIKAISSNFHTSEPTEKSPFDLSPKDLQSIYEIRHKILLGRAALAANKENLKAFEYEECGHTLPKEVSVLFEDSISSMPTIHMTRRELNANTERAGNLMERMDGVLGLVSDMTVTVVPC